MAWPNQVFCCYAEMCTALRREHDFLEWPRKSLADMLPGPYVLPGKTKIVFFTSKACYEEICTALRREHDF